MYDYRGKCSSIFSLEYGVKQSRIKIAELISYGWSVALQWVPSHVGIPGNERANQKAKQGDESSQLEVPLTLRKVNGPILRHLERAEAVANFRLNTGHDFPWEYTSSCLAWPAHSADMPGWIAAICSNALDSMNIRG
ncbi:reverse transcriptase [Trichonephila clavipes]|nr:reverse transcriptase [Trichonephila clavipes]